MEAIASLLRSRAPEVPNLSTVRTFLTHEAATLTQDYLKSRDFPDAVVEASGNGWVVKVRWIRVADALGALRRGGI